MDEYLAKTQNAARTLTLGSHAEDTSNGCQKLVFEDDACLKVTLYYLGIYLLTRVCVQSANDVATPAQATAIDQVKELGKKLFPGSTYEAADTTSVRGEHW